MLVLYIALTWPEHVVCFCLFAAVVADVAISVAETHETREIHSCLPKRAIYKLRCIDQGANGDYFDDLLG